MYFASSGELVEYIYNLSSPTTLIKLIRGHTNEISLHL